MDKRLLICHVSFMPQVNRENQRGSNVDFEVTSLRSLGGYELLKNRGIWVMLLLKCKSYSIYSSPVISCKIKIWEDILHYITFITCFKTVCFFFRPNWFAYIYALVKMSTIFLCMQFTLFNLKRKLGVACNIIYTRVIQATKSFYSIFIHLSNISTVFSQDQEMICLCHSTSHPSTHRMICACCLYCSK